MIFYRSFYEAIKELPVDVQAIVYSAIFEYSLNFNEVVLEGLPKAIFTLIKPQLDANNKRYENGKKGGKPNQTETKPEPKPNQTPTEPEPNKNVNVNNNLNTNENILLKKETKEYIIDFPENETNNTPSEQKEKSCAKKEKPFDFKTAMLDFGFSEELTDEWLMIRKKRKAINSQMAFKNIVEQIKKTNQPPDDVLKIIVNKQWKGFNAEWLLNENSNGNTDNRPKQTNARKVSGHQYAAGILSEQLAANSEGFDYSITP